MPERSRPGSAVCPDAVHASHLQGSSLAIRRGPREHAERPAIDPLFRSAAVHLDGRVVGVLLTGMLDDGTAGLQAIKACGGTALVQDPDEAEESSMPLSAIRNVEVDAVLPLRQLAARIVELADTPVPKTTEPPDALVRECAAATMDLSTADAIANLNAIATPSNYVCPDCGGALWKIQPSQPARFRCHTGHGFSLRSLNSAQSENAQGAMWSTIRALQERRAVLVELAHDAAAEEWADDARNAQGEADRIGEQALVLRSLAGAR